MTHLTPVARQTRRPAIPFVVASAVIALLGAAPPAAAQTAASRLPVAGGQTGEPVLPAPWKGPAPAAQASMAAIIADLEAFAQSEMAKQKVPGLAFAIVQNDQLVHAKGYGVKKLGGTAAVGAHTVFEVGSTTKAFTSALVGMLVDQGTLNWNDSVVDRLPKFAMYDPWVTREFRIDDLMAQRSGMPGYSLDPMSTLGWPRQAIADAVAFVEPVYSARSEYSYVNSLWLHASFLVEKYGGLSWENAMARRILGPLGMTESTVDPEVVPMLDDIATGHITLSSGTPWVIPADWPYRGWLDTYGPAGSLRSNVVDMSKWARLHLGNGTFEGKQLLASETVSRLHAARTTAGVLGPRTMSYAQGWLYDSRLSGPVVWHNGGTSGMHSIVCLYPSLNVALVVLTNTNGNTIPEAMDARLYGLLFPGTPAPTAAETAAAAAFARPAGPARIDRPSLVKANVGPEGVVPPLPLSRYAGSFSNPAYGTVTVREKSGSLALAIGPRPVEMPAVHFSGNIFMISLPGMPESDSPATFVVPSGGSATRLQLEWLSEVKGGWFERTGP